jgi:hypothetical protein
VEGVLVAFCFVFVFEAVVAVGACILFFHFVRAGFGVSIHVVGGGGWWVLTGGHLGCRIS